MAAGGGDPAASPMKTPSWAVRIRGADGEIAGAGILLTPDRVLTCAHVVDRAAARLTAEFVGAADHSVPAVPARVDGTNYVPETLDADGDPSGDVALLRLERPRPVEETVRLHRLSAPGREVRMYGFPYAHNGGIWFRSTVVGGCGRDGQVQLSPVSPGELASPGCSGAGVADSRTGEVIGMVLSGQLDQHGNRFSFMSPAETIARHLPGL
ncbi:trypsin-like serine protease, partial [Streptomyces sp. SID6013]|nr:trypsin-like serine protease [Streptomyces sp. SID6013]